MHKRMRVLIAQESLELSRIATERLRNLLGVEAGQTTGQMRAGFVIDCLLYTSPSPRDS